MEGNMDQHQVSLQFRKIFVGLYIAFLTSKSERECVLWFWKEVCELKVHKTYVLNHLRDIQKTRFNIQAMQVEPNQGSSQSFLADCYTCKCKQPQI